MFLPMLTVRTGRGVPISRRCRISKRVADNRFCACQMSPPGCQRIPAMLPDVPMWVTNVPPLVTDVPSMVSSGSEKGSPLHPRCQIAPALGHLALRKVSSGTRSPSYATNNNNLHLTTNRASHAEAMPISSI